MSMISVKAREGRVVRESPTGKFIPTDKFVSVENTAYVRRLIHEWGDLEVEPTKAPSKAKSPEPAPTLPAPVTPVA